MKPSMYLQRASQSHKMDLEVPEQLDQTLESSGIYSDSELDRYHQSSTQSPRTTFRDSNGQIRSLVAKDSPLKHYNEYLFTQSCSETELGRHHYQSPAQSLRTTFCDSNQQIRSSVANNLPQHNNDHLFTQSCCVESVNTHLNKSLQIKRQTRRRECYDIRVQMGNQNSTVEKIRKNTIDKLPSRKHHQEEPELEKELEYVSITPQYPTMSSQVPYNSRPMSPPVAYGNISRPMSPGAVDVMTNQIPQSRRPSLPATNSYGNISQAQTSTQIPQSGRSSNPFLSNSGNPSQVQNGQVRSSNGNLSGGYRSNTDYDSDGTRSYAPMPSNPRRPKHYASSQIGGYTSRNNKNFMRVQSQDGPSNTTGRLAPIPADNRDDSFVMMPNLNRHPPKKAYSVIAPPTNYNQNRNIYDARIRTESNTSFGLSCDRSSNNSYIANLKSDGDIAYDICNTFWRPQLTFNQYKHGDEVVDFGSLWPDQSMLRGLLEEAYQATSLRRSVLDICKLVIRCGPVRVLQTLVSSRIIGVDQVFDNGCSMLHLACLARNYEAVQYLISAGISQKILDKYGRTANQLCYDPRLRRQLAPQFRGGKNPCQSLKPASMHDKETIFNLAKTAKDYDELQIKLQSLDFDVNQDMNRQGDYLVHLIARQGLSQLPQLLSLVKIEGACIEQYNHEGMTPLMIAAESENVVMVDVMLCILGANPNAPNPNTGECALHYAAKNNNVNVVNCLITRGADFNLEDSEGNRPDDSAARFDATDSHNVIVGHREQRIQSLSGIAETGFLTSAQIRVTDLYQANNNGDTLIMTAAKHNRVDNLLMLIEREGCHVDAQHERNGRTALAMAAIVGHEDAVRELLKYDANPAIPDIKHDLPLHQAIRYNHLDTASIILQYPAALTGLAKALTLCSTSGAHDLVRQAISRRLVEIVTPDLFECALCGDARKLYCCLEEGDFVNPTSGVGDWPLFLAADNGHADVVTLLHQHGGDVSRRHPSTKNTVLHAACFRGHTSIVKYLMEHCQSSHKNQRPLNLNALNAEMKTALQIAAEKGYSKLVRLLLNNGAACAFLDRTGSLFCCRDFQGVQVLIEAKREAHARDIMALVRDNRKIRDLRAAFQPKFDHNLRDKNGDTPLMVAARFAYLEVVKFLLESAIHNLTESDADDTQDGESDTDSGTVMDLVNTVSSTKISKGPPQELVSVVEKRRDSQDTAEMLDTDADVTYADFVESNEYHTSSTMRLARGQEPRNIRTPPGGQRQREGPAWIMASTGHIEQNIAQNPGHRRSHSRDLDAQTVCEVSPSCYIDLSASNLFGYSSKPNNSIFMTANVISHVCAVNPRDGRTPLHRSLESGDHVGVLLVLIEADDLCANIQDSEGWSPLHLACKLGRKKCVEKLSSLPHVDLNSRALDGKLPEEMTNNRHIRNTILKAREQQPNRSSPLPTIEGSITGQSIDGGGGAASTVDFDHLNEIFDNFKKGKERKSSK